jgi:hypothetical protein
LLLLLLLHLLDLLLTEQVLPSLRQSINVGSLIILPPLVKKSIINPVVLVLANC